MPLRLRSALAAFLFTTAASATAGPIQQDQANRDIAVNFFEPEAQSFTAQDAHILFAFWLLGFNTAQPVDPLQFTLRAGDGLGGAVLATQTVAVGPLSTPQYVDIDFSAITLSVGQMYTVVIEQPGTSNYYGIEVDLLDDPYSGGRAYFTSIANVETNNATDDFRFRITPVGVTDVPEPGVLALLVPGVVALAGARRRRRA